MGTVRPERTSKCSIQGGQLVARATLRSDSPSQRSWFAAIVAVGGATLTQIASHWCLAGSVNMMPTSGAMQKQITCAAATLSCGSALTSASCSNRSQLLVVHAVYGQ